MSAYAFRPSSRATTAARERVGSSSGFFDRLAAARHKALFEDGLGILRQPDGGPWRSG